MKTDIQIAQEATMLPIKDVAANYGITEDDLELYGKYKAKFSDEFMNSLDEKPDGKLVLMTAINPTPAGEGKTTTSVGLTVRAAGSGKKVLFYQFLKNNSSSERSILEKQPGINVVSGKELQKFTFQMNEEELKELRDYNNEMLDKLFEMAKDYDMLVLDESVYSIDKDLLDEAKLIEHLEKKPFALEVVLSGRNPSERLIDHADYVSEIRKVKHPFDQGISSRIGIEM